MSAIKVMADYGCWPLWWDADAPQVGNIAPEALGLSEALRADLEDWGRAFDATLDPDDPVRSGFLSPLERDRFNRKGEALAGRVARELGDGVRVRYAPAA